MVTSLGSLVQLCCGEGGTRQTNITAMFGECSQCIDHMGFASAHDGLCFPSLYCSGSRLLCRGTVQSGPCVFVNFPGLSCSGSGSRVLHKGTDLVGHVFCALPRSEKLRQPGTLGVHCPRWSVHLHHLPGPGRLVSWVHHKSAISGVPYVSSGELISGCNPSGRCQCPGSQEDLVSNWEPAHNLVEDAIPGAEIALAFRLLLLPTCLSASGWGMGWSAAS